jgi:hypothetical protein
MPKPPTKPSKLLPGIKYEPRGEGEQRGSGDYEYYNRANSYASNPDYAQNFGGGGGAPPVLPSPLQGSAREGYAHGDMPIDQLVPWIGEQIANMDKGFGASNSNPLFFRGTLDSGANVGRVGPMAPQPASIPNWMAGAGTTNPPQGQDWMGNISNWWNQTEDAIAGGIGGLTAGLRGIGGGGRLSPAPAGAASTPGPNNPLGAGVNNPNEPAPMANQYNRMQDATNKNQALTEKAKAAGDDKEMKRLDDEWARLTSTPLYKQMYGGADAMEVKNRLINSYMQPDNEAAEPSFERAHARMVTDDWWAEEMTKAGAWGDQAQNDRLWAEHWHAMNKGGRDPLEGHPQAIQNLEAKKEELKRMNQQSAYDMLQQWQTKSGNL